MSGPPPPESPPPDNGGDFGEHPDIKGLRGFESGRSAEYAKTYGNQVAANLELLRASERLVELSSVPVGGELHVVSGINPDEPEEFTFVRTAVGSGTEDWMLRTQNSDGSFSDDPVQVEGSVLEGSPMSLPGAVVQGADLEYRVVHRARGTSGADFPNSNFSKIDHISDLPPDVVERRLSSGYIVRDDDGTLLYNVPVSIVERRIESVTNAWAVLPEAEAPSS